MARQKDTKENHSRKFYGRSALKISDLVNRLAESKLPPCALLSDHPSCQKVTHLDLPATPPRVTPCRHRDGTLRSRALLPANLSLLSNGWCEEQRSRSPLTFQRPPQPQATVPANNINTKTASVADPTSEEGAQCSPASCNDVVLPYLAAKDEMFRSTPLSSIAELLKRGEMLPQILGVKGWSTEDLWDPMGCSATGKEESGSVHTGMKGALYFEDLVDLQRKLFSGELKRTVVPSHYYTTSWAPPRATPRSNHIRDHHDDMANLCSPPLI